MIVFVATVQQNDGFIQSLKKYGIDALHPFYSFENEDGVRILEKIGKKPAKYKDYWSTVFEKDRFCIENSDVVIYDLDNLPDEGRYLAMAACLKKPVICVSEVFKPGSVYFSGCVLAMLKPSQFPDALFNMKPEFFKAPELEQPSGADGAENPTVLETEEMGDPKRLD